MKETILGIHFGHDATAALMVDGEVLEVMGEERLSRQKKHAGYPHLAVLYIKRKYQIEKFDKVVVLGDDISSPLFFATVKDNVNHRSVKTIPDDYIRALGARFPVLGKIIKLRYILRTRFGESGVEKKARDFLNKEFNSDSLAFINHHEAHALASVPFLDDVNVKTLIFTLDGAGDGESGSISILESGKVSKVSSWGVKESVGLLYSGVTDLLGMARNEHEFKVMGLAPYAKASSGEVVYQLFKKLVWFDEEEMTVKSTIDLDRSTAYLVANNFHRYRFDSLAYGVQKLVEEIAKKMVVSACKKYNIKNVVLAGGVFMNVKANQCVNELPEVDNVFVVPSCGDESLAIGCLVRGYALIHGNLKGIKKIDALYLGSEESEAEIDEVIKNYEFKNDCVVEYFGKDSLRTAEMRVAELLAENNVVGRMVGRSEWGARALGNRSILANASSRENVKLINEMIKGRDFWMPFATSMLEEDANSYLVKDKNYYAPYMSITFATKEKAHKELPAALHPYDLTSRPQMVRKSVNPSYHNLIIHFKSLTGTGGILNTSFNLHGEPNVETAAEALRTFYLSGLKHVQIGRYVVSKK